MLWWSNDGKLNKQYNFEIGDLVWLKSDFYTNQDVYEINHISEHGDYMQLQPVYGGLGATIEHIGNLIPIDGYADKRPPPPKCDCGAAAIGGIPHSDYCTLYGTEEVATKRKPRNEWD